MLFSDKQMKADLIRRLQKTVLYSLCFLIVLGSLNVNTRFGLRYNAGDISTKTIYAPYDFSYPIGIDEEITSKKVEDLLSEVLPFYRFDDRLVIERYNAFHDVYEGLAEIGDYETQVGQNKVDLLLDSSLMKMTKSDAKILISSGLLPGLNKHLFRFLKNFTSKPLISRKTKDKIVSKNIKAVTLIQRDGDKALDERIDDIDVLEEIFDEYKEHCEEKYPENTQVVRYVLKALSFVLTEYIVEDLELYNEKISLLREKIEPVYKMGIVRKNEVIIEKGRLISDRDIGKISTLSPETLGGDFVKKLLGQSLLLLLLLGILFLFLLLFGIQFGQHPKNIFVSAILMSWIIITVKTLLTHQYSIALVPLSAFAMLVTLLIGVRVAFMLQLVSAALVGLIEGINPLLMFTLFAGACTSIYFVKMATRRAQILIAGVIVAFSNSIVYTAVSNVYFFGSGNFNKEELFCFFVNGIISAILVMGLLPFFEYVFKYCTNITLLELSDLNNPLLRELTLKSPGTYHHSLVVGNLAEAACDAIGANSLLARVGSYYHDIGKTLKPQYFTENEYGAKSLHQKLAPSMSALIITNHVKDGIAIAKKHKLPQAVIDFIPAHHGTSLIYYFYQRAQTATEEDEILSEQGFRHVGPRPHTKETAIVMLADSVEASSRTLKEPTPAQIKTHVTKIINTKFIDGQLNECDLTLKDIHKVTDSFIRILAWSFHTRIEYPSNDDKGDSIKLSDK